MSKYVYKLDSDRILRFEGMTRDQVDAEVTRLDAGGIVPSNDYTVEQHLQWFQDQDRMDHLFKVLDRWPSDAELEAVIDAALEQGVTRVEIRRPPQSDDD